METDYDMYIIYSQLIFISSPGWLRKTTYSLYENSLPVWSATCMELDQSGYGGGTVGTS
jgi:hypothetical protein